MSDYTLKDLEAWGERIQDAAVELRLDFYPQEFEICDYYQMLGYLAYNGMPAHYPHWSFGKAFEKQKTMYDYGVTGLPYEMVINSNPALAYLMRDNSLALQLLTIGHVYAHNDFFKNNRTFCHSRPEYTLEMFKAHSGRIRSYTEDPSIGMERVEKTLDAAHALSFQCIRHLEVRRKSQEDTKRQLLNAYQEACREARERSSPEPPLPDLYRNPLDPEDNVLLFIRDHNPYLADWQKDILTIVAEETQYFLPQMETKTINEGFSVHGHWKIMNALDLPQGLHMEFLIHHNQVVRPAIGRLNPYHLGFAIFQDIEKRFGKERVFQVRESDRDVSFLRQYLTEELMRELHLFSHEKDKNDRVVAHVSDKEDWESVRDVLIKNTGLASIPVIKILDANHRGQQALYLWHEYDGREIELTYAQHTLRHAYDLWGRRVVLETQLGGKPVFLSFDGTGSVKLSYRLIG